MALPLPLNLAWSPCQLIQKTVFYSAIQNQPQKVLSCFLSNGVTIFYPCILIHPWGPAQCPDEMYGLGSRRAPCEFLVPLKPPDGSEYFSANKRKVLGDLWEKVSTHLKLVTVILHFLYANNLFNETLSIYTQRILYRISWAGPWWMQNTMENHNWSKRRNKRLLGDGPDW